MFPCLGDFHPRQTATRRMVVRCGYAGLAFVVIVWFGLLRIRAAEQTLPASNAAQGGLVALRGNTRPEAVAKNDRGRVSDDLPLPHLLLLLQRTPEQEQALEQFLQDLHNPASPLFHHWITAAEFGQAYGAAPADVARVTDWLESQGFKVNLVYPNQMVIDFTGTAGQIRQALHTEIHNLLVNGQAHIANMSDPQIPLPLASTVAGIVSLNDFMPRGMLEPRSNYTAGGGSYLVVPADLWTIYNFNPAFAAGYSGQGQTIVVLEDSDLYSTADWETFRSVLGLASAYPEGSLAQVHPTSSPVNNCADPGINPDELEAAVDVEWASAGAPSAAIELASCMDTETWGGFLALQNLLNASGPPPAIVSISYGESESLLGASSNAYINSLYQQAVAEGVSVFVSSGDQGAASSDVGSSIAQGGINVSGLTSTPYNVSVGGTDFADTYERASASYWNSTNAANYGSALSYVPEIPWNDSCASVLRADFMGILPTYGAAALCNHAALTTVAGSGGPSGCATGAPDTYGITGGSCAGYAKPWWQSGLTGNPNDGVRDIPDVSLFASNDAWGHSYVVCFSDTDNGGVSCNGPPDTWFGAGGTSFSAPIMAGIQSLVNQASGSRWGNPNPAYYSLAATEYGSAGGTSCNSALGNQVASNCIFYDVTPIPLLYGGTGTGGDIDVPCIGVNCYLPSGSYGVLSTAPQSLSYIYVPDLGSGYTSAPSCALSGGWGSGAACRASLTGLVSSLTLTSPGSDYVPAGTTCTLTGGGGTGASCVVGIYDTGAIAEVLLCDRGSGYTSAPTCTISGGGGNGATCTATAQLGVVVSLTAGGSGYITMPHCVLSGGGGTGATCAALALNTSDAYRPAFSAGTWWDFATGIGTVNASNLVNSFTSGPSLSPSSLAFTQAANSTSAARTVTMTNTGAGSLGISTVTISGTNASNFAKSADTCTGATLAQNATCTVGVTFTPNATGSFTASLNFYDHASNSPQSLSLSATGTGAVASVSPSSLTFSAQWVNTTSAAQTVTLSTTGSANLTFTALTATSPFAIATTGATCSTSSPVAASGSCTINVTFTPTAPGSFTGTLTITDNGVGTPGSTQTVSLSGTGMGPWVSLSPSSLSFSAQIVGTSSTQTVTLSNTGNAALTISSIIASGVFSQTNTCGATLSAGGNCAISVTFKPVASGTVAGTLSISDNAAGTRQAVALAGTGIVFTVGPQPPTPPKPPASPSPGTRPLASLSSSSLTFGAQNIGTTGSQMLTLTNTGKASLAISSIAIGGDFSQTNTCGGHAAAGSSCTINVTFKPTTKGTRRGALTIIDNNDGVAGSRQVVTLSGTGGAAVRGRGPTLPPPQPTSPSPPVSGQTKS